MTQAPRRGRPPRTTRAEVVATALELARDHGLDGVSLRAVAQRLGVHQTSLYTYVGSKDELLRAMLDEVFTGDLELPGPDDPRAAGEQLSELLRKVHARGAEHPELLALVGRSIGQADRPVAAVEWVFSQLSRLGLDEQQQGLAWAFLYQLTVAGALFTGNSVRAHGDASLVFPPADPETHPHLWQVIATGGHVATEHELFERELELFFGTLVPAWVKGSRGGR